MSHEVEQHGWHWDCLGCKRIFPDKGTALEHERVFINTERWNKVVSDYPSGKAHMFPMPEQKPYAKPAYALEWPQQRGKLPLTEEQKLRYQAEAEIAWARIQGAINPPKPKRRWYFLWLK